VWLGSSPIGMLLPGPASDQDQTPLRSNLLESQRSCVGALKQVCARKLTVQFSQGFLLRSSRTWAWGLGVQSAVWNSLDVKLMVEGVAVVVQFVQRSPSVVVQIFECPFRGPVGFKSVLEFGVSARRGRVGSPRSWIVAGGVRAILSPME